jgi:hypothetical protein
MKRQELINKIKKQAGFATELDAFMIVDEYTNHFEIGPELNTLEIQDQLIIMLNKIKGIQEKVFSEDGVKECKTCKETFLLTGFHKNIRMKDGHKNHCKTCVCKNQEKYVKANKDTIAKQKRESMRRKRLQEAKNK